MEQAQQKRRPSVTILDPIIPQRDHRDQTHQTHQTQSSASSSPSNRPIPLPSAILPQSPLQRSRDGSIILPSAPTHEPEDLMMVSQPAISSATTSTSSLSLPLSLPPSPTTFTDHLQLNHQFNPNPNSNRGMEQDDELEELEELADEEEIQIPGKSKSHLEDPATPAILLPRFDPVSIHNKQSSSNQSLAELSLTLLAVQLAALKALHSLFSTLLSAISNDSSTSATSENLHSQLKPDTSTSSDSSSSPHPPKELLTSLIDAVEESFNNLLPEKSASGSGVESTSYANHQSEAPRLLSFEADGEISKQQVPLARLTALLENLPSLNLACHSTSSQTQFQATSFTSDIQLSSTLGALVKALDRVRVETNRSLGSASRVDDVLAGESEESSEEESVSLSGSGTGSGSGSYSAPASASLSNEGFGSTSPLSPPSLVDRPSRTMTGCRQTQTFKDQSSDSIVQASTSSTSLPLATASSRESLSASQRRGSFPSTSISTQFPSGLMEEQLRDPFAETSPSDFHPQHHQADVFATLHKLMANLSGRNLPATLASEKGKSQDDSEHATSTTSTDSHPTTPSLSSSEPFCDREMINAKSAVDSTTTSSTSSDSITQVSNLLAITQELVAVRRAAHSPTFKTPYGYGISSSSLRSRSAAASSASLPSQNQVGGAIGSIQAYEGDPQNQSIRGDLNGVGRLSRTSSGSARSDRLVSSENNNTTGTLTKKSSSPSFSGAIGSQSPSTKSPLPPKYEDEDLDGIETRSVDTHASLRSSLIGSQSTALPAYAGLGIASSEKGEKEKDRTSISSSTNLRSPNASSTALHASPQSILRNPLPFGGAQLSSPQQNQFGEREKERARSLSGRSSEYAARTSADLNLVQSSIERLYNAVPQLADQRVAAPPKLTAVNNKMNSQSAAASSSTSFQSPSMDINIEELVMRMGKRGRMEDQRADLSLKIKNQPSSSLSNSKSASPTHNEREEDSPSSLTSPSSGHHSRFSVGSLSGLGSLRRIGGKGKSKEDSPSSSNDQRNGSTEIVQINSSTRVSNMNSSQMPSPDAQTFDDVKGPAIGRKSKLDKMGIPASASGIDAPDLDDPLFDLLASSQKRMSDQEAVVRPGSRIKSSNFR